MTFRPVGVANADEGAAWTRLGFWVAYCKADEELEGDGKELSTETVGTGGWGETGDCGW